MLPDVQLEANGATAKLLGGKGGLWAAHAAIKQHVGLHSMHSSCADQPALLPTRPQGKDNHTQLHSQGCFCGCHTAAGMPDDLAL
jgi:hypothetical protein